MQLRRHVSDPPSELENSNRDVGVVRATAVAPEMDADEESFEY